LPPLVASTATGTFNSNLSPTVRIDELDPATGKVTRTVATYTMTDGPGGVTVRLDPTCPCYAVRWDTKQFNLNVALNYRIVVSLPDRDLGVADVDLVASGSELRKVDTGEFIPLLDNRTLPIKFFINACATVTCAALDSCHDPGVCDPATGACTNPTKADFADCDDNDPCTYADRCSQGTCVGKRHSCDSDACNLRACNGTESCTITPQPGNACDDHQDCTFGDTCDDAGACVGTAITCSDDACNTRACNGTSSCAVTPLSGVACDDGDLCTVGDTCDSGRCVGSPAICVSDPCGNGVVDPGESCDTAIASGTGSCPTPASCDDRDPCTIDGVEGGGACTAVCKHDPITTPISGDTCCPPGASSGNDSDCPSACGNAVVDPGERCDVAIVSGYGSCPTSCDDGDVCTRDDLQNLGTCMAQCVNTPITTPAHGDGCCPPGANANNDNDCPTACGNYVVEPGEECDDGNTNDGDGCSHDCHLEVVPPTG
jgi:cysteine-rich repeat protein